MLLSAMLIPAIMLVFGNLFAKRAPKNINYVFGYRTTRSMKNEKTWKFAHNMIGKLWRILGIFLFALAFSLFFFLNATAETLEIAGSVIMGVQIIALLFSIIPVEVALGKHFDKDGNPK